jgi:hypothetical protein
MKEGRTSLQSLAANLECDTHRVLRTCKANIACYPEAANELTNAVAALKLACACFGKLMHKEDLHETA